MLAAWIPPSVHQGWESGALRHVCFGSAQLLAICVPHVSTRAPPLPTGMLDLQGAHQPPTSALPLPLQFALPFRMLARSAACSNIRPAARLRCLRVRLRPGLRRALAAHAPGPVRGGESAAAPGHHFPRAALCAARAGGGGGHAWWPRACGKQGAVRCRCG